MHPQHQQALTLPRVELRPCRAFLTPKSGPSQASIMTLGDKGGKASPLALTQPFTANLAAISRNDRCPACAPANGSNWVYPRNTSSELVQEACFPIQTEPRACELYELNSDSVYLHVRCFAE